MITGPFRDEGPVILARPELIKTLFELGYRIADGLA